MSLPAGGPWSPIDAKQGRIDGRDHGLAKGETEPIAQSGHALRIISVERWQPNTLAPAFDAALLFGPTSPNIDAPFDHSFARNPQDVIADKLYKPFAYAVLRF
jgi:hypothetical protein